IAAPFRIRGVFVLPTARFSEIVASGAEIARRRNAVLVRFSARLGGGRPLATSVTLSARARSAPLPSLRFRAAPVPPAAAELSPPAGNTWVGAVSADSSRFSGRALFD